MRDVIQVERADGTGEGPGALGELARVADELLPPLVARLGVSDLSEIEVRQGTWRVRIRRATADPHTTTAHAVAAHPATGTPAAAGTPATTHASPAAVPTDHLAATSTAVGYFAVRAGLAAGHRVSRGDVLGWVDVLGVRKEMVAPADGVISRFVTEPGDPVEYGQELVSLMAATGPGGLSTPSTDAGTTAGIQAGPA